MHLKKRIFSERGDTVVEVLIAIAVVSLILGGAFVTANRSLQNTRDAQERQNALKMTEMQLEQLKYLSEADPKIIFGPIPTAPSAPAPPSPFCLISNVPIASSDGQCRVTANGTPTTAEPGYRLSITRVNNLFTVRTTWTSIRGIGQNLVEIKYRVHQ